MKLASALLFSLILCSCSPLRYKFTNGTSVYHKTESERIKAEKEAFQILNQ